MRVSTNVLLNDVVAVDTGAAGRCHDGTWTKTFRVYGVTYPGYRSVNVDGLSVEQARSMPSAEDVLGVLLLLAALGP